MLFEQFAEVLEIFKAKFIGDFTYGFVCINICLLLFRVYRNEYAPVFSPVSFLSKSVR